METDRIKQQLLGYVQQVTGEEGSRRGGRHVYFRSPLHEDRTASFCVDLSTNKWHDFGMGSKGDVIDLVMQLRKCDFKNAVQFLSESRIALAEKVEATSSAPQSSSVCEVQHPALISYAASRCVSEEVLRRYCVEYHQGKYFYLGFKMDSGGYELRNQHFKGCAQGSAKSITTIKSGAGTDKVLVFEGMFDFLSYATMAGALPDCVVLNTVECAKSALPILQQYTSVHTYLDNDEAGSTATKLLAEHCNVVDHSFFYQPFNDVNEYICTCTGTADE